ncbi:MAG: hypothetical protein LBS44_02680 [Deltaproteobacteria bacterium]|jgi:hypothetical protein|nr:hypothetical protein [Deltaproteobacteria bacterium]
MTNNIAMPWDEDYISHFSVDNFLKSIEEFLNQTQSDLIDQLAKDFSKKLSKVIGKEITLAQMENSPVSQAIYHLNKHFPLNIITSYSGLSRSQIEALGLYLFLNNDETDIDPVDSDFNFLNNMEAENLIEYFPSAFISGFVDGYLSTIIQNEKELICKLIDIVLKEELTDTFRNNIIPESKKKAQLHTTMRLLKMNMPVEYVVTETGLSQYKVEQLGLEFFLDPEGFNNRLKDLANFL